MKIYPLEKSQLNDIRPLVQNYQFKPYKEYKIKQNLLERYVVDEISRILSHEENLVLVAEQKKRIAGLTSLERLDWDSKHFGIKMAKIGYLIAKYEYTQAFDVKCELIHHILASCKREISHVSARVRKEDLSSIHALEREGFRLMDVLVTHCLDLRKTKLVRLEDKWPVREVNADDVPRLAEIATECFKDKPVAIGRFHADPSLPKEKCDDLYVEWLLNSCNRAVKKSVDTVLVAEMEGVPVGFSVCKIHRSLKRRLGVGIGSVILTGVARSARGKSVHSSLLNAALRWFADKVDIVEVGSQVSNYAVQRAWNKLSFKMIRSQCTLHWSTAMENNLR